MLILPLTAAAQVDAFQGFCNRGGQSVSVAGLTSTNKFQNVIPHCSVTVYLTGTTTKATIYADSSLTALANPFTADALTSLTPGKWLFYAADGVGYDVIGSGGDAPNTFPSPVALGTDLIVKAGGGGGGGCTASGPAGTLQASNGSGGCVPGVVEVNGVPTLGNSPYNFIDTASVHFANSAAGNISATVVPGVGQVYPPAGVPTSTGSAWGTSYQVQGTDINLLSSGTVAGLASPLCTDAQGGATTVGCPTQTSNLEMVVTPPIGGQYVVIRPQTCTTVDNNARTVSECNSSPNGANGKITQIYYPSSSFPPAQGQIVFTNFPVPSFVNPANATAVYVGSTNGQFGDGSDTLSCGPTSVFSGIGLAKQTTALTTYASSNPTLTGLTCTAQISNSSSSTHGGTFSVPDLFLVYYYTGTAPPADTATKISPPLLYFSGLNTLAIDPAFPMQLGPMTAATLPNAQIYTGYLIPITDGPNCAGGGSTPAICQSDGSAWNSAGGGGSSGFPITIGSTSVGASSTTTALSGLSVNGVTLNASGSSTLFLNQAGGYTTPPGSGGGLSGQTINYLPLATSATQSTVSSAVEDTGSSLIYHGTGTTHGYTAPEGTPVSGVASSDVLTSDSTTHRWLQNPNNTGAKVIPGTSTTAATSGNCVQYAANGYDIVDAGAACGSGSGGGYTNLVQVGGLTTVAAINTACSGGTAYATSPLSIATGGTVTCPYQATKAGLMTVASGQVVTFSKPVTETDGFAQIFAGSGTVVLGASVTDAPVEWFGADIAASAATNVAAVVACVTALTAGQCTQNEIGDYSINGTITIAKSNVGLAAPLNTANTTQVPYGGTTSASCYLLTSASANFIDLTGISGTRLNNNVFSRICQKRSLAPTGTATGINVQWTFKTLIEDSNLADNITQINCHGCANLLTRRNWGFWGYNGVSYSGVTTTGIHYDTSGGVGLNSAVSEDDVFANNSLSITMSAGLLDGTYIADLIVHHMEAAGESYGFVVNDGSSDVEGVASPDIHFHHCVFDGASVSAYLIENLKEAQNAAVEIDGGEASSKGNTGHPTIDIESSSGVTINGTQIWNYNSTPSAFIKINGGSRNNVANVITHNQQQNIPALWLNSTAQNNITAFTAQQHFPGGTGNTAIALTGSSDNKIDAVIGQYGSVGISADATSNTNQITGKIASGYSSAFTDAGTGNCWMVNGTLTGCGGTGGTTTNPLTANSSGGAAAGTTFDGSVARTFDYHSFGALAAASGVFTGTPDASGATQFKMPVAASGASAANGEMIYDSTNKNWHFWQNGADHLMVPLDASFTSGHCAQPTNSGGSWTLVDAGGACGVSGGGASFSVVTSGTNTTAAMLVGAGSSLDFTSTGTINATKINGVAVTGTPSSGMVPTATSSSTATWQASAAGNYTNVGGTVTWANCTYSAGLCSTTGTVASVTISSIPTGLNLVIQIHGSTDDGGGDDNILLQFNADTANNYDWAKWAAGAGATGNSGSNSTPQGSAAVCALPGSSGSRHGGGTITIVDYTNASISKTGHGECATYSGGSFMADYGITWSGTSAITSVKLAPSGHNFVSGTTFSVYVQN